MTNYRGFAIEKTPKPIPDRSHDYDAYRVDGNWAEGLVITGSSEDSCKALIDEYWDDVHEIEIGCEPMGTSGDYTMTPEEMNARHARMIAEAPAMLLLLKRALKGEYDYPEIARLLDRVEGKSNDNQG